MTSRRFLAASILSTLAACSTPVNTPDSGDVGDASHTCVTTIAEVQTHIRVALRGGECPSRWEDVPSVAPCSASPGVPSIRAGACGSALVYFGGCNPDSFACAYDATTHELVGAAESTDYTGYCGNTASCMTAGTLPSEITCMPSFLSIQCNPPALPLPDAGDAGTEDATAHD